MTDNCDRVFPQQGDRPGTRLPRVLQQKRHSFPYNRDGGDRHNPCPHSPHSAFTASLGGAIAPQRPHRGDRQPTASLYGFHALALDPGEC
ncbi:hypothetical protein [Oxynema aestuarii]|uniref:Uncharacterized protein n=1 Tax=Oxynema aestuarii AP17 TaxID=2064643 RepID=A0A6H1TSG0_9CYAN|nr:hypothetical protein [Oxynema aestuarii]QIZ69532.1 hypothetical protein HCG48_02155 [Oxynema aestuarii AP17]